MLNDYNLTASEEDLYLTTTSFADGSIDHNEFANWLKKNSEQQ
jgi:prophage maintenance system killer protein